MTHQKPVLVCSAYRSPKSDKWIPGAPCQRYQHNQKKIIYIISGIVGGMNMPDISLESNDISMLNQRAESVTSWLFEWLCNLDQLVNFQTRKDNILDILLTTYTNNTLTSNISVVPGISDHTMVSVADVLCHPKRQKPPLKDHSPMTEQACQP